MQERRLIRSPDTLKAARVPPGQRVTDKWPVLHHGSVPSIDVSRWVFTISGLVEKKTRLSYEEFMALPMIEVLSDIHCVTGWSKLDNLWEGVSTGVIRDLAEVLPEAKSLIIHGAGDFTTNLTLDDFLEPDVLFAVKHNGERLTLEHGYPLRLVVPRLYFWKSAKWVVGVEFAAEDRPGFWEGRGYHNRGDPWKEERYSH